MAIAQMQNPFLTNSVRPIIGTLDNRQAPNCLHQAKITASNVILPGEPIVVLASTATPNQDGASGFNPNTQTITAKATTTNTGANSTAICGFMITNATDRVIGAGVAVAQQGDIVNYAPLGGGAYVWLEVASQNLSDFKTNLDTNTALTIDASNGGVKVGAGADIIVGAKLVQSLTNCQKIKESGGIYVLENCVGVLVKLG